MEKEEVVTERQIRNCNPIQHEELKEDINNFLWNRLAKETTIEHADVLATKIMDLIMTHEEQWL